MERTKLATLYHQMLFLVEQREEERPIKRLQNATIETVSYLAPTLHIRRERERMNKIVLGMLRNGIGGFCKKKKRE